MLVMLTKLRCLVILRTTCIGLKVIFISGELDRGQLQVQVMVIGKVLIQLREVCLNIQVYLKYSYKEKIITTPVIQATTQVSTHLTASTVI